MFRRALALAGSLGLAAIAFSFSNVGVRADTTTASDHISFAGFASITTDSDADTPAAVDITGGSGSFGFASTAATCLSDNEGTTPETRMYTERNPGCSFSGTGTYTNVMCGTGTASGTANITGGTETGTVNFSIAFTDTIGTITGTSSMTGPDDLSADTEPITMASSKVIITAGKNPGINDTGDCANGFTFAGHADADETGSSNS
jgi:hypothetical protein